MIGIQISTYNRPDVLRHTVSKMRQYYSDQFHVIVIDDASDCHNENREIVDAAGFEYILLTERTGIPHVKNIGFERLLKYDQQFWFDDDCFPIVDDWHVPILKAMERTGHILYLKDWFHIKKVDDWGDGLIEYSDPTACFMTFDRDMYDDVQGFSKGFPMYGSWHPILSRKMFEAGHSIAPYMSLGNISTLLNAFDLDGRPDWFRSSLSHKERYEHLEKWNKRNQKT